jgi:integrase
MAFAARSGKGWLARWKAPEGSNPQWPSKSGFKTKREAEQYGEDREAEIRAGAYIDPKDAETTIDQWWTRWFPVQDHLRPNSRESYERNYRLHIKPRWGGRPLGAVKPIEMQEYRVELRKVYSESTVTVIMAILRGMFADAAFNGMIGASPLAAERKRTRRSRRTAAGTGGKAAREPILITLDTLDAICARLTPAEVLLVHVVFWTGMRWSEVAAMRRSYLNLTPATQRKPTHGYYLIDPDDGAVHEDVHSHRFFGPPKSGADGQLAPEYKPGRVMDLPPFLVEMLLAHVETMAEGQDLLFPNRKGVVRQYDNWNTGHWRKACDGWPASPRKAPAEPIVKGLRLHDGKHFHAAMMDDLGTHPVLRDYRLGHATPGTRGVYSHPTPQMRAKLIKGLQRHWEAHQASKPTR